MNIARALATASASAIIAWLALAMTALAASPAPTAGSGGDPRSSGQGPGLVGDPVFALLAVVGIGLASFTVTFLYVRLTTRRAS